MSLFRRVTRYRVAPTQNPQENRLTEVTAAVLERVEGLAQHVIVAVLATAATAATERRLNARGAAEAERSQAALDRLVATRSGVQMLSNPRLRLWTQRTTKSGKFVDLELLVTPQPFAPGKTFLFWVEIKHGAGIHGTQLGDYETDIKSEHADERIVLVLAPRQSLPNLVGVPEATPVVEWQVFSDAVRHWSKRPELGEVDRFLLDDYLAYLNEEGLMDAEFLTAEHAFVLSARTEAEQAIAKVMEVADAWVQKHWGQRGKTAGGKKPVYGPGYWALYPIAARGENPPESWRSTTFEWGLIHDGHRDEPRNAWAFIAGATFSVARDSPASLPENAQWLLAHRQNGFEYVQSWYWRLWRHLYPEELLGATTLDAQAALLGGWVVQSFELLAGAPPPR